MAASFVVMTLLAGVIGTTLGWFEARRQTVIALANEKTAKESAVAEKAAKEQALKRLTQIEKGYELLSAVFGDLDIRRVKEDNDPLEAVLAKRLVKAGEQLDGESIGDPLVVASLQNQLGRTLDKLGFRKGSYSFVTKGQGGALNSTGSRPSRYAHQQEHPGA